MFFNFNIKKVLAGEVVTNLPAGFDHEYTENDTYLFTYMSTCTVGPASNHINSNTWKDDVTHIQAPQGIVIPASALNGTPITNTYVFFHGLLFANDSANHPYPSETVASPTTDDVYRLYTTAGRLSLYHASTEIRDLTSSGKVGVMFIPRLYQIASNSKDFNTASTMTNEQYKCFFDEATTKLKLIVPSYTQKTLTIMGHSAGGNSVKFFSKLPIAKQAGYKPDNILLFDACYADWCQSVVRSNVAQNYYIYYNADDKGSNGTTDSGSATAKMTSNKIKVVSVKDTSHPGILSNCFVDHANGTLCNGKGTIEKAGAATPTSQGSTVQTQSEINIEIKKPILKINIPGLNFSEASFDKMKIVDPYGNTWLSVPYLGEYIAAVYKYGIIIISILAVFGIIIGGVTLMASGGNNDLVSKGKKRIIMSIIAVVIATTSYALLYTINPNLVNFKNIQILLFENKSFTDSEETSHLNGSGQPPPADGTVVKIFTDISEPNIDDFKSDTIDGKAANGFEIWSTLSPEQKNIVLPYLYDYLGECKTSNNIVATGIDSGNFKNIKLSSEVIPALKTAIETAKTYGFELTISEQQSAYRDVITQTQLWNTGIVARYVANQPKWMTNNEGLIAAPSCIAPHSTGGAIDIGMKQNGNVVVRSGTTALKTPDETTYIDVFFNESPPYKLILEEIMRQAGWVRYCDEYWHFENSVLSARYNKWDKDPSTRCVAKAGSWNNWKTTIPPDIKTKANATVQNGPLFK